MVTRELEGSTVIELLPALFKTTYPLPSDAARACATPLLESSLKMLFRFRVRVRLPSVTAKVGTIRQMMETRSGQAMTS